jgi:hypothetical protein
MVICDLGKLWKGGIVRQSVKWLKTYFAKWPRNGWNLANHRAGRNGTKRSLERGLNMTIKVYTKLQEQGISEGNPGMMEYGYGLYVNAFVIDTDFENEDLGLSGECGMYATEKVSFEASDATIARARKRARERARHRYIKDKTGG